MAEVEHGGRRRLAVWIGAPLAIGVVATLLWAVGLLGAQHGAADPSAAATPTPSSHSASAPSSTPRSISTPRRAAAPSPEPSGGPLTVVALGDSVPAATSCDCDGYPALVGRSLHTATGRAVTVRNDAANGWTTSDVESDLDSPQTAVDLGSANLVIVEVGANDFDLGRVDDPDCLPAATSGCWKATLTALHTDLTNVVAGIRRDDTRADVRVVLIGYWNLTLDGEVGRAEGHRFVTGSNALTLALNDVIRTVASGAGATYVDAYAPFKNDASLRLTSALLDDGDHLNAKGHAVMAAAIMHALTTEGVVAGLTNP